MSWEWRTWAPMLLIVTFLIFSCIPDARRVWKWVVHRWTWLVGACAIVWVLPWSTIIAGVADVLTILDVADKFVHHEPGTPLSTPTPKRLSADRALNIVVGPFRALSGTSPKDCCLSAVIQQDLTDSFVVAEEEWQGNERYSVLKVDNWKAVENKERQGMLEINALRSCDVDFMVSGTVLGSQRRASDHLVSVTAGLKDTLNDGNFGLPMHYAGRRHALAKGSGRLTLVALQQLGITLDLAIQGRLRKRTVHYERLCDVLNQNDRLPCAPPPAAAASTPSVATSDRRPRQDFQLHDAFEILPGILDFTSRVMAGEPSIEAEIRRRLRDYVEQYNAAYKKRDIRLLADFYEPFDGGVQRSLQRYFDNVDDLVMRIDPGTLELGEIVGPTAVVTFTREDVFTDREERSLQNLHLRLTVTMVKTAGQWRIALRQ